MNLQHRKLLALRSLIAFGGVISFEEKVINHRRMIFTTSQL